MVLEAIKKNVKFRDKTAIPIAEGFFAPQGGRYQFPTPPPRSQTIQSEPIYRANRKIECAPIQGRNAPKAISHTATRFLFQLLLGLMMS